MSKRRIVRIMAGMLVLLVALLVTGCAGSSTPTQTEGPQSTSQPQAIELKLSHMYTPPNPYAVACEKWIEYIQQKSNGHIKIAPYWGGTLIGGKDAVAELKAGTADIGYATLYTAKGYEITTALQVFLHGSPNANVTSRICREILAKYPEFQQEFADLVALGFLNGNPYFLISKKPVRSLKDLKGMKISAGVECQPFFVPFGASVTKMPPTEQYSALEKGIIDATFLPLETLVAFRFAEVAKYVNMDIQLPSAAKPTMFMHKDRLQQLPPDVQELIVNSVDYLVEAVLDEFDKNTEKGLAFAKEQGVEFLNLSEEDVAEWQQLQRTVAENEAKKLDQIGKRGTEIYRDVQLLIEQYATSK